MSDDDAMTPGEHEPGDYRPHAGGGGRPGQLDSHGNPVPEDERTDEILPAVNPLNDPSADQSGSILNPARTTLSGPEDDEAGNSSSRDAAGAT